MKICAREGRLGMYAKCCGLAFLQPCNCVSGVGAANRRVGMPVRHRGTVAPCGNQLDKAVFFLARHTQHDNVWPGPAMHAVQVVLQVQQLSEQRRRIGDTQAIQGSILFPKQYVHASIMLACSWRLLTWFRSGRI
jgi:hypothetical protein